MTLRKVSYLIITRRVRYTSQKKMSLTREFALFTGRSDPFGGEHSKFVGK
jgi:hypothetical protein